MTVLTMNERLVMQYVLDRPLIIHTLAHPHLDELLNMDKHTLSLDELPMFLLSLLDRGWIDITIKTGDDVYSLELLRSLVTKDPKQYFKFESIPTYELTAKGGFLLEQQLGLNWENFVYFWYFEPEVMQGGADWKLLNVGAGSESNLQIAVRNIFRTTTYEELWQQGRIKVKSPWQPTYWKEVPIGYSLQILVDDNQVKGDIWEQVKWRDGLPDWRKSVKAAR
jgi:hypothetical protein